MRKVHAEGAPKGRKWIVETHGGSENLKLVESDLPFELDEDSVLVEGVGNRCHIH